MKRIGLILVITLAALAGAFAYSKSRTHQLFGTIVPRVETERKVVALTFDDGPTAYAADHRRAAGAGLRIRDGGRVAGAPPNPLTPSRCTRTHKTAFVITHLGIQ